MTTPTTNPKTILVTGASSGFGALTVRDLAVAGHPDVTATAEAYESEYAGLMDQVGQRLASLAPADQDPTEVSRAVTRLVDTPKGRRPFRVHIDPADDGAEAVNAVGDRIRTEFYQRIGLEDLLAPAGQARSGE